MTDPWDPTPRAAATDKAVADAVAAFERCARALVDMASALGRVANALEAQGRQPAQVQQQARGGPKPGHPPRCTCEECFDA